MNLTMFTSSIIPGPICSMFSWDKSEAFKSLHSSLCQATTVQKVPVCRQLSSVPLASTVQRAVQCLRIVCQGHTLTLKELISASSVLKVGETLTH